MVKNKSGKAGIGSVNSPSVVSRKRLIFSVVNNGGNSGLGVENSSKISKSSGEPVVCKSLGRTIQSFRSSVCRGTLIDLAKAAKVIKNFNIFLVSVG